MGAVTTTGHAVILSDLENRGLKSILRWGFDNFHKLSQDNKVKIWIKVYDKVQPTQVDVNLKLSEAIKNARERAILDII